MSQTWYTSQGLLGTLEATAGEAMWPMGAVSAGRGSAARGRRPLTQLVVTPLCSSGPRLSGGHSLHETSTVLVETVTKSSSSRGSSYSSIPKFSSDASKVVTRGPGLSQAFVGQKNSFTVDCSKAGMRGRKGVVFSGVRCQRAAGPRCEPAPSVSFSRHQHDDGGRARAQDPL